MVHNDQPQHDGLRTRLDYYSTLFSHGSHRYWRKRKLLYSIVSWKIEIGIVQTRYFIPERFFCLIVRIFHRGWALEFHPDYERRDDDDANHRSQQPVLS